MTELTSYTLEELAAADAEKPSPPTPAPRRVTIVQADLFNEQSTLFGHVSQPSEL